VVPAVLSLVLFDGEDDHAMTTSCSNAKNRRYGTDSKVKSALIVTPRRRVFSDQYQRGMDRSEKNGTPFEELEEIVFENCLPRLPTLEGTNHEHLQ
jgi:hypothetical protein